MTTTSKTNPAPEVCEIYINHADHTVELYTLERKELIARFPIDPYRVTVETTVSTAMDVKVPTRPLSYYDVATENHRG